MQQSDQMPAVSGLGFFGNISAAATHDLKNFLAIINEHAGLLEDLTVLADSGRKPLSGDRIKRVAQKIRHQVGRADQTLKRLNRFSHSVDTFSVGSDLCAAQTVSDLEGILALVLDLADRRIQHLGARIEVTAAQTPCLIAGEPFFLMQLFFEAIRSACWIAAGTKRIEISFGDIPGTPEIRFSFEQSPQKAPDPLMESDSLKQLLDYLNIRLIINSDGGFCLKGEKPSV